MESASHSSHVMTTTEPPDLISNNKYHLYGEWNKRLATRGGRLQRFSPAVDINPPSGKFINFDKCVKFTLQVSHD